MGLGELRAEEYLKKDNPMAWALAPWMRKSRRGRARLRLQLQVRILRTVKDQEYKDVLLEAVRTYFALNQKEEAEELRLIYSDIDKEVREEMLTAFDKLKLEGELRGERNALRRALFQVLVSRFKNVPETLQDDVSQISETDRLEALIQQSATARTLEEALAGLRTL